MGVVSKIQRQLFNLIRSDSPPDLSITGEISRVYRRMGYQEVDTDQRGKWKRAVKIFSHFAQKNFKQEASIGKVEITQWKT